MLYSKYGGTEAQIMAQEYRALSARDVLAIIEVTTRAQAAARP